MPAACRICCPKLQQSWLLEAQALTQVDPGPPLTGGHQTIHANWPCCPMALNLLHNARSLPPHTHMNSRVLLICSYQEAFPFTKHRGQAQHFTLHPSAGESCPSYPRAGIPDPPQSGNPLPCYCRRPTPHTVHRDLALQLQESP
jgi:hypothetical protein